MHLLRRSAVILRVPVEFTRCPRPRFWDLGNYNPFRAPCVVLRPAGAQWG